MFACLLFAAVAFAAIAGGSNSLQRFLVLVFLCASVGGIMLMVLSGLTRGRYSKGSQRPVDERQRTSSLGWAEHWEELMHRPVR